MGSQNSIGSSDKISHFTVMQIWAQIERQAHLFHAGVITIGNFDGLHLGHQELLRLAQAVGQPRIVMTFDPHPLQILHPEKHLKRLLPRADLFEQLPYYGIDLLVMLPFDRAFANQSAETFVQRYLLEPFQPRHIVAGYDFAFGKEREGTLPFLRSWAAQHSIAVDVAQPLQLGGQPVSSRRIRESVIHGDMREAARLLGRPFYLRGEVVHGAGRGHQIGVPTLNQKVENETTPLLGVYASRARGQGQSFASVTNIGVNPTFGGTTLKVETHVLDQTVDWRGVTVDVDLIERLRGEQKFNSIDELRTQIAADIAHARRVL